MTVQYPRMLESSAALKSEFKYTLSHPRWLKSSVTLLWEPQTSQPEGSLQCSRQLITRHYPAPGCALYPGYLYFLSNIKAFQIIWSSNACTHRPYMQHTSSTSIFATLQIAWQVPSPLYDWTPCVGFEVLRCSSNWLEREDISVLPYRHHKAAFWA